MELTDHHGSWPVSWPDQVMAWFFVPLPEAIGIPQGSQWPSHSPVAFRQITEQLQEQTVQLSPISEHDIDGSTFALLSSARVWHVHSDHVTLSRLDAMVAVSNLATREGKNPFDVSVSTHQEGSEVMDALRSDFLSLGLGYVTVLEVAVPLRVMGSLRARLQRAYYAAARVAITLVSRDSLPQVIPVSFRKAQDIDDDAGSERTTLIQTQVRPPKDDLPMILGKAKLEAVAQEIHPSGSGPFALHLDLYRESQVALRDGDRRLAGLLLGVSAECSWMMSFCIFTGSSARRQSQHWSLWSNCPTRSSVAC